MSILDLKKIPLTLSHPEIAKMWHPTKNGMLNPKSVTSGSGKRVWWLCPVGVDHEWNAQIYNIVNAKADKRCPYCRGAKIAKSNCLETTHPEVTKLWHPIKNGKLTPKEVKARDRKKVWWLCPIGSDHEWEAQIYSVVKSHETGNTGCPCCRGLKVAQSNCLETTHPEIAKLWHPTKNGKLTSKEVTAGSNKRVWWKCSIASDHEWDAKVCNVVNTNTNKRCPCCRGIKIVKSNCLETTHPEVTKLWHPTKNGKLKPNNVTQWFKISKIWWKCPIVSDHEWDALIYSVIKSHEIGNTGCPCCRGLKVAQSNCLETTHPEIAKLWHPTKNGKLTSKEVTAGSNKRVWWKCSIASDHEWEAAICSIVKAFDQKNNGCPYCRGLKVTQSNCLETTHPEIVKLWHPTKNGKLTPKDITKGYPEKVWWKCPIADDHEWSAYVYNMTKLKSGNLGCPCCRGYKVVKSNCLETTHPEIAKLWHPTKNGKKPNQVYYGTKEEAWWKCPTNGDHEWEAPVYNVVKSNKNGSSGCFLCNKRWTIDRLRLFVKSILPYIHLMTPAELYVIFQQHGVSNRPSKSKNFLSALRSGRFPQDELEKFVNKEQSLVDDFSEETIGQLEFQEDSSLEVQVISEQEISESEEELPIVETKDILTLLDSKISANMDKEAVDFFVNSAIAKIWHHVFLDEPSALNQLKTYNEGIYSQEVKQKFLDQYQGTLNLSIPKEYSFRKNGKLTPPNLMQRFTAFMVQKQKRFGNWSGTGAGKTLSAILSSRLIDSQVSIICCPNSVIDGWKRNIEEIFPDSIVITKNLSVDSREGEHHYLILNYEFFQQRNSESKLKKFLKSTKVDFVVIDEIHFSKQRIVDKISKRKKVISAMLSEAYKENENLCVLGMSATPVINNLFEGKTLIELITGFHHDELSTKPSVGNCIALYQKFIIHGVRWIPKYDQKITETPVEIDCGVFIDEIKSLGFTKSTVDLEVILTKAKIPQILKHLKPKTIVYTYYLKNILGLLKEEIEKAGWKAAVYSGDDKSGLDEFLNYDTDILIATSCLGTGVDGLQEVCNRIVINTLPWTHAEFEQLKGRIYRQGQRSDHVDIIIPITYAIINGKRWSWCDSRWKRIQFKKSIADAAVDGVIPERHLRTPAQAYQDVMKWLERLQNKGTHEVERRKIDISLSDEQYKIGLRKFGDFSKMNHRLSSSSSSNTHRRFLKNPEEWEHYHTMYREARKDWNVVPYKEAIKWCRARPHLIIGDFGCGEAFLAKELENKVYSLDHVAINDEVIACDIAHTPLDDESLDAAIFSLSLMGSNYLDYIKEAYRCLKLDGHLWIAETTSRFQSLNSFAGKLVGEGFDIIRIREKGKFSFLRAIKSDRKPIR